MVLKVFTIYDSKAEAYMQPFFMQTKGQAMRALVDTLEDPKTQFCKHPEDFTLFEIGTYDDQTGKFENLDAPVSIGNLVEFKNKETH